jgi:nodulation protein E
VVVTGMGAVTPIGTTVADFWAGCRRAQVGVGEISGFDIQDLKILIAAQIKDFDPKARLKHFKRDKIILHADRYSWFAAAAADEAVNMAGLQVPFEDPYRVACIVGSGVPPIP